MENQKKKLRLDELKVESFVTNISGFNPNTLKGGEPTFSASPCLCSHTCPPPIEPPADTKNDESCIGNPCHS